MTLADVYAQFGGGAVLFAFLSLFSLGILAGRAVLR